MRWPDVPAVHGWLSLDRRGGWRLKGEPVTHGGLIAFLNAHYGSDGDGNWFVQNGPQRVFVTLDYTPLVLRLDVDDSLTAHTGAATGPIIAAYLDEDGNVLLHASQGVGLLDDRDLSAFVGQCRADDGGPASDAAFVEVMGGGSGVVWHGLPLQAIRHAEVAARFAFRPRPEP
ncbi:putative protein DUf2944/DUF2946 [Aromatoleum bremense]|uniref:DUF2946 family protein n=1 Tax=Aromatoleum bremense TaxID=76115 RepID=A0ABX1NUD0_9RHOO|nr:DUF2946 family protein [Aromatoleum bremense]QTQ33002.1 putative protein DUf2944/DUF2946 [Aromatoleum bremense]